MNLDHISTDLVTGRFKCEICGQADEPPFQPAPVDVIHAAMDHFISLHEFCKPPSELVSSFQGK